MWPVDAEPLLLLVPADPEIEATCWYARAREQAKLVEETEEQMAGPAVTWLTGIDWAIGPDSTSIRTFKTDILFTSFPTVSNSKADVEKKQ